MYQILVELKRSIKKRRRTIGLGIFMKKTEKDTEVRLITENIGKHYEMAREHSYGYLVRLMGRPQQNEYDIAKLPLINVKFERKSWTHNGNE